MTKSAVLELPGPSNWFHVKSEWKKNPEISTLCVTLQSDRRFFSYNGKNIFTEIFTHVVLGTYFNPNWSNGFNCNFADN